MNLQHHVDAVIGAQRKERMNHNDQLTLGGLIDLIRPLVKKGKEEPEVIYDFGNFFPTSIDSWRGVYAELALNYKEDGKRMHIGEFLEMLEDADGETFTGYKGGNYTMGLDTPLWVANPGQSGSTAIVGVIDKDYYIVIETGYRE